MKLHTQRGLTLIELLLVIGILSSLFGIGIVSLSNIQIISGNSSSSSVIISDLKNQQIKSMVGDTEGRGTPDNYGMKILSTQYILFHGNSYNASETSNFAVPIDEGNTLSSTFPNTTILFASDSGELVNFVDGQNTITLTNTRTGRTQTVQMNKYGTITNLD